MSIGDGVGGGESPPAARDRYTGLATLLRSRREALGISRRDLAAATGLSYPYIAQLEGGYRAPSVTTARRLADALHLPVEEIVHATGEATTTAPTPVAHILIGRDDAWLGNPAYAPGIGAGHPDASVAVPAAPMAPRSNEPPPTATAPSGPPPTATAPSGPPPTAAAPTATPNAPRSSAPASGSTPSRTPALPPHAPAAPPARVAPSPPATPPAATPPAATPPSARHGLFGRRREGTPRETAGTPTPPAAPGPAVDPVAATVEQITALLRALPASDRLDTLAAVQRDVMAQLVEDRIRSGSQQAET